MEKNKKIIAIGIGAMLFLGVVFFVAALVVYVPPKKIEPEAMNILQRDSVNTPPLNPSASNIEKESTGDAPVNNSKDAVSERELPTKDPLEKNTVLLSGIMVTLFDQVGNKISGNKCALEVSDEKTGQWTILYSKLSDQNGNCHFYDLDSERDFLLVIYWTGDRAVMSQMSLGGSLIPGKTSSWSVSQAGGFREIVPSNSLVENSMEDNNKTQ